MDNKVIGFCVILAFVFFGACQAGMNGFAHSNLTYGLNAEVAGLREAISQQQSINRKLYDACGSPREMTPPKLIAVPRAEMTAGMSNDARARELIVEKNGLTKQRRKLNAYYQALDKACL